MFHDINKIRDITTQRNRELQEQFKKDTIREINTKIIAKAEQGKSYAYHTMSIATPQDFVDLIQSELQKAGYNVKFEYGDDMSLHLNIYW